MTHHIFVDGQEGTTGLRIHEMLARRSDVEVLRIDPDKRKDAAERARLLNAADVAFLCLPDAAAREAVALVTNPNTCIIDASTAHRTVPGWAYGLPELDKGQRQVIRASKRIANPGCHATAFVLMLRPLVQAGLLPATAAVSATSITGYSGGGKSMIAQYEAGADPRLQAPRPYGLGLAHKHLPEMKAHTGLTQPPVFMPVVAGYYKGLAVSVGLQLDQFRAGTTAAQVQQALAVHYAGERFIQVLPLAEPGVLESGFFDVQANNDTNNADVFVFANGQHLLLMCRIDNLGKGASGAAVQCMNVHLGVDESLGLV